MWQFAAGLIIGGFFGSIYGWWYCERARSRSRYDRLQQGDYDL